MLRRQLIILHASNTTSPTIAIARQIIIELPRADLLDRGGKGVERIEWGRRGSPNVFVFPRFLRGSPNRPRFKFNPPELNRSILIYEYPPIRSGGRKRDSRVIYDRIRSVICKKSIIYGRHRRRSGRFLGLVRGEARAGAHSAPDSPHCARVSLYTERDLSEETPNLSGTPAATCHLHVLAWPGPRRLGKYFKTCRDAASLRE